jgi:hypothetical protein
MLEAICAPLVLVMASSFFVCDKSNCEAQQRYPAFVNRFWRDKTPKSIESNPTLKRLNVCNFP